MALQAYSLARDGSTALSPHFCVREFRCKDGSDPVFIDTALAELLERIREHFGKPVTITSAYRTPAHNAKAGGAKFSQHLYGRAADIRVQGVSVEADKARVVSFDDKLLYVMADSELVDVDLLADAATKAFDATFDVDDSLVNEDESELPPELLTAPAVAD